MEKLQRISPIQQRKLLNNRIKTLYDNLKLMIYFIFRCHSSFCINKSNKHKKLLIINVYQYSLLIMTIN